ncbi:MAG: ECF transporter S component, partial [Spirochaetales bacterium]|nr:ECF transporter S component [Spirochaetales bacterium]
MQQNRNALKVAVVAVLTAVVVVFTMVVRIPTAKG